VYKELATFSTGICAHVDVDVEMYQSEWIIFKKILFFNLNWMMITMSKWMFNNVNDDFMMDMIGNDG